MEIAYRINCTIKTRGDSLNDVATQNLLIFDTYLHTFFNFRMGINNERLIFALDNIQPDGDIIYYDTNYPISVKKGKDILTSWINNALDLFKSLNASFGYLTLPISENDDYLLKYINNNLLICGMGNVHPCFSYGIGIE